MNLSVKLFSGKITNLLDDMGCHPLSGQEYLLRQNYAAFRFRVRISEYDKGYLKLLIIQGLAEQGYMRVEFIKSPSDRADERNSNTHEYFTAKASYI